MEIEMRYAIVGNTDGGEKVLALASTEDDAKKGATYYKMFNYGNVHYEKKKEVK